MNAFGLVLAWLALAAPAASRAPGEDRVSLARIELWGPCQGAVVTLGNPDETTRVEAGLLPGERLALVVPVSLGGGRPQLPPPAVEPRVTPGSAEPGGARSLAWVDDDRDERWERRSPLERAWRPGPPWTEVRPGAAALALLVAGGVLVLGARRRPLVAAAVGSGLAGLLAAGPLVPAPAAVELRVLTGRAGEATWLEQRVAREALDVEPGELLRVEVDRDRAELSWRVQVGPDATAWTARAPRTVLRAFRERPAPGSIDRDGNELGDLADAWIRDARGAWRHLRAWPRGAPVPLPDGGGGAAGAPSPPGWLASGLPQGVGVLLGRLAEEEPGRGSWVRLVGFGGG